MSQFRTVDDRIIKHLDFKGAQLIPQTHLPFLSFTRNAPANAGSVIVKLQNFLTEEVPESEWKQVDLSGIPRDFEVSATVKRAAGKRHVITTILPLRRVGTRVERLTTFDLDYTYIKGSEATRGGERDNQWVTNSILSGGEWFKIATGEDGIFKVTHSFLKECGFDVSAINSSQIRVYGTGGGALSMNNADPRPDDLQEIPLYLQDGNDGIFDAGDFFLFYGEDQVRWLRETAGYKHEVNPYADSVYYFITTTGGTGVAKRIVTESSAGTANVQVTTYDFYNYHEQNTVNLIKSGRDWYGEELGAVGSMDFGFSVPEVDKATPATVRTRFAVRSVSIKGPSITLSVPMQGAKSGPVILESVPSSYASQFAQGGKAEVSFSPVGTNFQTKLSFDNAANREAQAWIDYIEINARRTLRFLDPFMGFRDSRSVGAGNIGQFILDPAGYEISVWDVTDRFNVRQMTLGGNVANGYSFTANCDSLKEFVAFSESAYKTPTRIGWVVNQNLHGLQDIEYVVVTHPLFMSYAEQMAELHQSVDNYTTAVVTVDQIYNEFSGGAQDITAIKEFMRMLYKRAENGGRPPKYLLLLGDASYDYKNRVSGNSNFVPSYQTSESLLPTASVVSDDYYGLLDDDEGDSVSDLLDIATGRLPARSKSEAQKMVNKILHYTKQPSTLGDWRNWVALVADDADPSDRFMFMTQSNTIAESIDSLNPSSNVQKIYMDAYKQVSGSGGERYPDASDAIDERLRKGALVIYYIGHGGELGWAHERVLEVSAINKWENLNNQPLFLTATCEFTRFDDPLRTSAGEYVMLNPNGGGVALLTTTRAVYSGPNFALTQSFTKHAFTLVNGQRPHLGDIAMMTKLDNASDNSAGLNSRCFTLIGDPAMRLAFPMQDVRVSSMPDTLKALEKVKVSGYVSDHDGNVISDFNGLVYPTLFDKVSTQQTLNNDGQGVMMYEERRNILFRGKASVKNGEFEFEFVVPKDIDRAYDEGKLSFYAHNGVYDAGGQYSGYMIGGLSDNPVVDDAGPDADLYMNNTKFVFGGITDENPDLYAELRDSSGINMVGSGIGHDITAVLDGKTSHTIVLNDYYEADVDSYQSGKVRYPFSELEEGKHSLKLQVWDVNNNPSDAYTEFIVASSEELALEHVLNYPNPFTTNTDFFFEHNKPGLNLDVKLEVFTVSGKLVKTIDGVYGSDGYRVGPINWNGRDEYGDVIGKGVYLYRLSVKTPVGDQAEKYERLVILK